MARSSAATARAAAPRRVATAAAGTVAAPARPRRAPARRKSGPAPRTRTAPRQAPARTLADRLSRLPETRLLDRLVRGRLWVGFVGALLAGIVFLNVSLLQLNQDIARTGTQATAIDRHNSSLRMRLASLDSSERIQRLAAARGMLMPAPGQYRYLHPRPWRDGALAARRVTLPHPAAAVAQAPPATAPVQSTSGTTTGQTATATPTATTTPTTATATVAATPTAAATTAQGTP